MALQYCPHCYKLGMTWYCEDNDQTFWYCSHCNYEAEEIKLDRCEICNESSVLVLKDKERHYRYCLRHEHGSTYGNSIRYTPRRSAETK